MTDEVDTGTPSPGGPRARRRETMSRDEIVGAALELIDERGLTALTMRALAQRLGANTPSIYWHAGGRDELLSAVAVQALGGIHVPDPDGDWREELTRCGRSLYGRFAAHPHFAALVLQTLTMSPSEFPLIDGMLATLAAAGFEGEELRHAYNTYVGHVLGHILLEFGVRPAEDRQVWDEAVQRALDAVDPAETPVLAAHLPGLLDAAFGLRRGVAPSPRLAASFEVGVQVLLDGLQARLPGRRG